MDWVDALLVASAEETGINQVLTLDERGFLSYRIHGRRPFQLLPVCFPIGLTAREAEMPEVA